MSVQFNLQNKRRTTLLLFIFCLAPLLIRGQTNELKIPAEAREFIGQGDHAVALEAADLNGDGTPDFILVTEKTTAKTNDDEADSLRTLMILTRDREGKLKLAKSNKKVVYCKSCGGAFGDPFDGVEVKPKSFTVNNYGGSAWRWSEHYQFNYSRTDKTWQLVRFESQTYNSTEPNKTFKTKIRTPKSFGKIDISDFDPEKIR